jgi:hypothetical protein
MREPWTQADLEQLLPRIAGKVAAAKFSDPDIRPLGPMTVDECRDLFCRLLDLATERPLTRAECFLHGQIEAVMIMAAKAEALGYKGRHFVVPEDEILDRMRRR